MERTLIRLTHVVVLLLAVALLGCESDPPRPVPTPPIVVNPDGSGDYPTIQAAVDSAEARDVIGWPTVSSAARAIATSISGART